jgi:DsbC/DsbD-like thiol-disulfide interchange protein
LTQRNVFSLHFVKQIDAPTMTWYPKPRQSPSLLYLVPAFALLLAAGLGAQSQPETHAKVQLISLGSIHPAGPFWVGVLFQLDEGWHIYWQNPGDSGEPPKIQWKLPPDWRASEIRWPRPILLGQGSVRDYGYESHVVLLSTLQPQHQVTTPVEIAATVKYVACREICVPGKAEVTLLVPVSKVPSNERSEWTAFFRQSLAQVPEPLPPEWKVSAISNGATFVLTFRGGTAKKMRFFPLQRGEIENAAPQTLSFDKNGLHLTLKKSEQLTKPIVSLRGVIVLDKDRAYEIAVPVESL